MKHRILHILAAGAIPLAAFAAEDAPSYTLSVPSASVLRNTTDGAQNEWLSSNNVFIAGSCWAAAPTNETAASLPTVAGSPQMILASCEAGFPVERLKPEVWLGNELPVPVGADWTKTYEKFLASASEQSAFIFDPAGQRVFAQKGGSHQFTWVLAGGEEQTRTYLISPIAEGRPYKLFWTDAPYNAPPVNMSGKYVRLFGPDSIVKPVYGTQVSDMNGQRITNENVIVSGVYLDSSSSCLFARGNVSGQFIVAFYDSGSYERLQRLQVVEVGEPTVNQMKGYVGEKIEPYGMGYSTGGLYPSPVALGSDPNDTSGAYYYQHRGTYSYSPKNNWLYPIRPTTGSSWKLDVYWMETDKHGIAWPFERCNYDCSWNTNKMTTLVAGAPVKLPTGYSVELSSFQEPEGHARAPEGDIFKTDKAGFSLLKVAGNDNIWFVPVRTIERTDKNFFTLEEGEWYVGEELRPRGGTLSGTAQGYNPVIDQTIPGLLNLAESGSNYNPELYYDWTSVSNDLESVIYAVNASGKNGKPLEAIWSSTVQQEGMPTPIAFPSLVQRYRIEWPRADQVPQIVLASQQGGAGTTRHETGACIMFDGASATMELPDSYAFHSTGGSVSFWANAGEMVSGGKVLSLGNGAESVLKLEVSVSLGQNGAVYALSGTGDDGVVAQFVATTPVTTSAWHKIAFSIAPSKATAFVDGVQVAEAAIPRTAFGGIVTGNSLGCAAAADGLKLDDVAVWARTFDAESAAASYYPALTGGESALSFAFAFPDGDLEPTFGGAARTATEVRSGVKYQARSVFCVTPGAPVLGNGVFVADETPIVYRQNDKSKTGYNPNEEHAYIASGSGGYYAWALRCDLNTADTSAPFVLAQYVSGGRAAMRAFSVVLTNEFFTALAANVDAGKMLPGPHPIDMLDNPWCPSNRWDAVPGQEFPSVYRDRKGQLWARSAGKIPVKMYYRNQDGFDFPSLASAPAPGVQIPWLSELHRDPGSDILANEPAVWTWWVNWPEGVPTMRIGETVTTAANGLPEVWNAKSVAVVWPHNNSDVVRLWDPTIARESGLNAQLTVASMLADFGFSVENGNVTLRAGKYTFKDLPPSIGDRFYVDTTKPLDRCVTLIGKLETNAGGSILWPNVASKAELEVLKNLTPETLSADQRASWASIIDKLGASKPVTPTTVTGSLEPVANYSPRDHYALTAMGGTGYVTLIENDAPAGSGVGQMGVDEGDAISMHVFAVTNRYYAGRVIAREDPLNLLSQQLSIIYTESFAGLADDYEFEWRKAPPALTGAMPTDYEKAYAKAFAAADCKGLTRFTLGEQGDTLANLVNTFWVMRYRALSGKARQTMGDAWSDWCGPTLAEGWIQRVVNNVTPFTQRMTDLYENRAETTATMIQAAGGPYMGDVALNQDNLTSVGLIQLYHTLLNKAESMSIASGYAQGVNDAEVNKQLLLAAERLADMYMVLGNEARADALNPTIGFGTTWGEASPGMAQIDYGAASSGLFCFDNQVPTLLDEELALLRGRTGANNPSVQTAPFYNRLVWNFTRGITAGEVAYAVNYNVNSSNGDATIDENDAALQYPQGHGDAYGHYLSALSLYYRLLRNPNFTWPASQSQMLIADAVVDVDYYDESRFAEIANKLAVTAADVTDRTARKAWRDNAGANGAGFLDSDGERNFGYGEWATRGAIGAVANWMVANAIIPESQSSGEYYRLAFDSATTLSGTNLPAAAESDFAHGWLLEFQIAGPAESAGAGPGRVLTLVADREITEYPLGLPDETDTMSTSGFISIDSIGGGRATVTAKNVTYYVLPVTNFVTIVTTNELGETSEESGVETVTYPVLSHERLIADAVEFDMPEGAIVAIDRTAAGWTTLRAIDQTGTVVANVDLGDKIVYGKPMATFGGGFTGTIGEIRGWTATRSSAELHAARGFVNPRELGLAFYTRGTTLRMTERTLPDETPGGECEWTISNPQWVTATQSGLAVKFTDEGLIRIDRSTVSDLAAIPVSVSTIQDVLDRLDAGVNPLGLSDAAVPFDISADGVAEGTSTHFEQIASRAESALGTAAKLLDRAQESAGHLRQIQNAASTEEELAATDERNFDDQLVSIYGTPYSGDIGPGKLYEQGYTGPDLYHYMYMDLEGYGLTDANDIFPGYVVSYNDSNAAEKWSYDSMEAYAETGWETNTTTTTLAFCVSPNGLIVKPQSVTGRRSAYGKIQRAYADYLLAYVDAKNALARYNRATELLTMSHDTVDTTLSKNHSLYAASSTLLALTAVNEVQKLLTQSACNALELVKNFSDTGYKAALNSTPSVIVAGLAAGFSPQYPVKLLAGNANLVVSNTVGGAMNVFKQVQLGCDFALKEIEISKNAVQVDLSWNNAKNSAWNGMYSAVMSVKTEAVALQTAFAKMQSKLDEFDAIAAEGDRILAKREESRSKRVNRMVKLRYNDMFFRREQDAALSRYSAAFDFAQRQVFMAAQAYDYETVSLSSSSDGGSAFKSEIIGARSLGTFGSDGKPQTGLSYGDPGLCDILARMTENYKVLKPRLGINNPDSNATWFSLRHGLFRIDRTEKGLGDWQKELRKYVVEDLNSVPEYKRFCHPASSSSGLAVREPAIVIPFGTMIDFGMNLFGRDLAAGDTALDSSYYATKIKSAGVKFVGYNAPLKPGASAALASTPVVYLVPAGVDRMRVPGDAAGMVVDRPVVDQVLPVPYKIGSSSLDSIDFTALACGFSGIGEPGAAIRRIPSFRAMTGSEDDADRANTRLVGRSAWNTRWLLIIPAGQMLGGTVDNRNAALDIFINGADLDNDGIPDVSPVTDIQLGLKTYSHAGN